MSYYYKCYKLFNPPYGSGDTGEDTVLWDNSVDGLGIISGTLSLVTNNLCHATIEMPGSHPNIDQVTVGTMVKVCRVIDGVESPIFTGFISTIDEDIYGSKIFAYTDMLALTDYCSVTNPSSGWNDIGTYLTTIFNYYNAWNQLDFTYDFVKAGPEDNSVWGDFSSKTLYGALQAISENAEKYSYARVAYTYYNDLYFRFFNDPTNTRNIKCLFFVDMPTESSGYVNTQSITLGKNITDITVTKTFPDYTCIYATDSSGHTFTGDFGISNYSSGSFGLETNIIKYRYGTYSAASANYLQLYSKMDAQNAAYGIQTSYSVNAIDMSLADTSVEPFDAHKAVRVVSEKHGIDSYAWITEYSIDLAKPSNNKITLGGTQARISK